jgi:hypothetical protein
MTLTADQMLAGASLREEVEVPVALLAGWQAAEGKPRVVLRPLAVRDLQRIQRAAKDDETLTATLMIQHAMLEPELKLEQISQLPAGLASFLVDRINAISGVSASRDALEEMVQAPLARACFVLAREFGWTPEDVSGMTIGQILVFVEMTRRKGVDA